MKREYTRKLISDFAQGCEVTLVGSGELASLAEAALSGESVRDEDIAAELAPCFVGDGADDPARTDTVVLACTHYPLLLERLTGLAPWPVEWIDPAPAIARRVADLLGPVGAASDGRRRDDLHLQAPACADRGADAVLRRPRPGLILSAVTALLRIINIKIIH